MARRKRRTSRPPTRKAQGDADLAALVQELQAQRVKLEAQNDALREAQHDLELSRDRYAGLFDFAPIPYVTVDDNGIILHLNFAAGTMLGLPRANLIGFPLINFVDNEHRGLFWGHL